MKVSNTNGTILLNTNSNNTFIINRDVSLDYATENVGVGYENSVNTTTGDSNTSIGSYAFQQNIEGFQNTAVGSNALQNLTNGFNNTAVGFGSFSSSQLYIKSTAIGYSSQPIRDNQIMLGTAAEQTYIPGNMGSGNTTTGGLVVVGGVGIGGNVYIGGNLTALSDVSFNGNLNVGQNVYINGVQLISSQWTQINGNLYYTGNIGINMNADPQYNLDVSGTTNITGNTIIRGNVTALSDVSFNGNLNVGQNVYIKGVQVTTGPSSQWTTITGNLFYNGNVGINMNTDPQFNLDVSGTVRILGNTQNTSALRITSLSNQTNTINIHGNMSQGFYNNMTRNNDVGIIWGSASNTATSRFILGPWSTSRQGLMVTNDGRVGINTFANPDATLEISGNLIVRGGINNPSYIQGNLYCGNVEAYIFNATSDYRVKENPILLNDTFYVDDLKPKFYKNKLSNREDMGFIAHEVQEVFPFLVNGEKDGSSYQSVNYNGFIALLVKEIQELKKRLKTTEDQLQMVMDKLDI